MLRIVVTLVCLLSLSSGKKGQEGDKGRPENWRKVVNKAIKRASEVEKKIKNVLKSVKSLDKKSKQLDVFSEYSEVLGNVVDDYPECAEQAKNANDILKNCKTTVPVLCSPPDISIKKAEECVDEKSSSFIRFLRCTSTHVDSYKCYVDIRPKIPGKCKAIARLSGKLTEIKDTCLDNAVPGSFGDCFKVVKKDVPTILNNCLGSSDTSSAPVESKTVFVEGDEVCYERTQTIVGDKPEETCSLDPQTKCRHITKLVP